MAATTSINGLIGDAPVVQRESRVAENLSALINELSERLKYPITRADFKPLAERAQPFLAMIDPDFAQNQACLQGLLDSFEAMLAYEDTDSVSSAEGSINADPVRKAIGNIREDAPPFPPGEIRGSINADPERKAIGNIREDTPSFLPGEMRGSKCCVAMITTGVATAAVAAGIWSYYQSVNAEWPY